MSLQFLTAKCVCGSLKNSDGKIVMFDCPQL
jgi:hypothetical protein